jgi:hypothetical protein
MPRSGTGSGGSSAIPGRTEPPTGIRLPPEPFSHLDCLGSTASTHFIGGAEDNFSDQAKILFRTSCRNPVQRCPEAVQSLRRNDPSAVSICVTDSSDFEAPRTSPSPPAGTILATKKSAARGLPLAAIGIDFNRILLSA